MAQQWEESTININHIGQQNLEQADTYESSNNILYSTSDPNTNKDYKAALVALGNENGIPYENSKRQLAKKLEERLGRDEFNKRMKQKMIELHKNDHSKQVDGAAEVYSLKSGANPSRDRIRYEKIRESSIESMRKNPVYQFCMLLAGYNNTKLSKYWITPSESVEISQAQRHKIKADQNERSRAKGLVPDDEEYAMKLNDTRFHNWYTQTAWADGMIHLSPHVYAHIEEAYAMVTKKWKHLGNVPLSKFIESIDVRGYFGRLVSWNMRTSEVLSGQRYHLDSTYRRVNVEKAKVLQMFKHVRLVDNELKYHRSMRYGGYVPGTQTDTNEYLDQKALNDYNPAINYDNVLRGAVSELSRINQNLFDNPGSVATMEAHRRMAMNIMVENSKTAARLFNNMR